MFRIIFLAVLMLVTSCLAQAQRKMENLDRGLVAVKVPQGVFLSWRLPGTEWYNTAYNIYRDGIRLNATPLMVSNFTDVSGTASSSYSVAAVSKGKELSLCQPVKPLANQYLEIKMKPRNTAVFEINDATAADLDGDGVYEIIVKRIVPAWTAADTIFSRFEAYKTDGTLMWEINVGPNIMPDVEINLAAFDLDMDGKAEVFLRTSEGTVFGDGTGIGDTDGDRITNYRFSAGQGPNRTYMTEGPEFLSLVDGISGKELDRVDFIPRGNVTDWGDDYGHRASKYFFGAPYLDGIHPSLFTGRGIYTKTIMRTYDVVNKKIIPRWEFNSGNSGPYYGQGNHNYTVADVDGDGRDEIVWGSMTVDDDGHGLYSTRLGHGDALHVGDMDPFHKGTEIFKCLESSPVWGTVFYDGATGEILFHHVYTSDCGRCMAGNITDDYPGKELWGGKKMFSASTRTETGTSGGPENFRIYWDGDLLEECTDHTGFTTETGYGTGAIFKYGYENPVLTTEGAISCNYTKGTPCLQADLFGDWREEVIWRNTANTAIRIYTTVNPTSYRIYSLMHDHQYRQAICWQMCGYNQPPHVSYFLGEAEGKTVPPPPVMTNNMLVYGGKGDWSRSSMVWLKDNAPAAFSDGDQVLLDISAGNDVSLSLTETVAPDVVTVNTPGNCSLNTKSGRFTGEMTLVKMGKGSFSFDGTHDFTGKTEIWDGTLTFTGDLQKSPVWLGFFGHMSASGHLGKGATLLYAACLAPGGRGTPGKLTIDGDLVVEKEAILAFDLYSNPLSSADTLQLRGNLSLAAGSVFEITQHLSGGDEKLPSRSYELVTLKDTLPVALPGVIVRGLSGIPYELRQKGNKIILEIKKMRQNATIFWNGSGANNTWDLALTSNFLLAGNPDVFVTGDEVVFNDAASGREVGITGELRPSSVWVNASNGYSFQGKGSVTGTASLRKSGSGKLIIGNVNDFTGKVLIDGGTVEVMQMPTAQASGAIGKASSSPADLELSGGTLRILGDGYASRAAIMGEPGGTIENTGKLYWQEEIAGSVLTKTGSGNLVLSGRNTHSKTILKQGTLTLFNEETNPGKTVVLEGGILQCYDNMSTYSNINWNMEVPAGKSAIVNLDSRAYYNGTLTGAGNVTLNIPNVRSDFKGDWSNFAGRISFVSTYSNSSGYFAEARFNNSYGLAKAAVNLGALVTAKNLANTAFRIGELTGTGELSGAHNWIIGSRNTNAAFNGTIIAGSLNKTGTGSFTLSGSNSYTGNTTVEDGTLIVSNTTGSATGTGNVIVMAGATLAGTGSVAGMVSILSSGELSPGVASIGKLTAAKGFSLNSLAYYSVDVNSLTGESDQLVSAETVLLNGILYVRKISQGTFAAGNQFRILSSPKISGSFQQILPVSPGEGLKWDTSELNSQGIIRIVAIPTSADDKEIRPFTCFPNPVTGRLHIDVSRLSGEIIVFIFDMKGTLLGLTSCRGGSMASLDTENLPGGEYLVAIGSKNELFFHRMVKR